MFLAEVTFRSRDRMSASHAHVWLGQITKGWWEGGQALENMSSFAIEKHAARVVLPVPERHSLAWTRTPAFTRKLIQDARAAGLSGPHVKILGPSSSGEGIDACTRAHPLILVTHAYSNAPPVRCTKCFGAVPLYRLRTSAEDRDYNELWSILRWQAAFRRTDQAWFDSGIGEKDAFRQLSSIKSELNRAGMEARESLEDRVGRPVYYFHWAATIDGDDLPENRPCPGCRRPWKRSSTVFTRFSHRCDRCRLVGM
jgi:predicted  nucleic acid-binding Zn ribbon protein